MVVYCNPLTNVVDALRGLMIQGGIYERGLGLGLLIMVGGARVLVFIGVDHTPGSASDPATNSRGNGSKKVCRDR